MRPIEAALKRDNLEDVIYYKNHGSKTEDADGRHILEKITPNMSMLRSLLMEGIYPTDKEKRKEVLKQAMFHDLNSLTPENIMLCRFGGVSLGSSLSDGTTFLTQQGRSAEQKQMWIKYARPE